MKRWLIAFGVVLLACIPVWLSRSDAPGLLKDTDTACLLQNIRERKAPLSWFGGDWPLKNHFYRPISTLVFEFDNWLYGNEAWGYGLTNVLLGIFCVLALFWFLRELLDKPAVAACSASLLALWCVQGPWIDWLGKSLLFLSFLALLLGCLPGRSFKQGLVGFFVLFFVSTQVDPIQNLAYRIIGWLPGRTASIMTLFALIAMAAYARYERLGAHHERPALNPLDPPPTKSTMPRRLVGGAHIFWMIIAILSTLLALGSYEQAVMLPLVLAGVGLVLRSQGYRVRWALHASFWAALVIYLVVRVTLVPSNASGYQLQQFKRGWGFLRSLGDFALPAWGDWIPLLSAFGMGVVALLFLTTYSSLFATIGNIVAYIQALKDRTWKLMIIAGWGLSLVAFLPMAWLKMFEHYYLWPLALRACYVVGLLGLGLKWLASAASPPALQAPPRPHPAPGSLPHP